jgi:ribosomal protein S18 acetylase RimI-like enzyme
MPIIEMTSGNIDAVVDIHLSSFAGFFLSFLGKDFLNVYYQGILKHQAAIKLIYLEGGVIHGFVVGTMHPSGFYSSLLRHDWLRFVMTSIPAVLRKPRSAFRIIRALAKPGSSIKDPSICELTSIAVVPSEQKKGIGKILIDAFIHEVVARSGRAILLRTDALDNVEVNEFYCRMGFRIMRVVKTPENRIMNEFWYEIN